MPDEAHSFLLAEYDALRREIEIEIRELGEFLRYGLLASGGIWAWLLSQQKVHIAHLVYFLPCGLTICLMIETSLVRKNIFLVANYLNKLEGHFKLPDNLGWERHLRTTRRRGHLLENWENLVWILLVCLNLGFAIYAVCHYK